MCLFLKNGNPRILLDTIGYYRENYRHERKIMIQSIIIYISGVISLPLFYWTFVFVHGVHYAMTHDKQRGQK